MIRMASKARLQWSTSHQNVKAKEVLNFGRKYKLSKMPERHKS